ncbi:hypothetical protein [Novosphingobium mathurense]|uniref:Uncharacterized protein n=1 Tax=Novosphingobium mathurense TaxID=428990 RepID=A0A1U6H626_9SPHN|nr:hypothetical protein [Novosphingobium mathurense]SLJ91223.1 hypothetical protein SAMN06295987_1011341 [Novosphingobium mathurense]
MGLEQQIEELRAELSACPDPRERILIEAELRAARAALAEHEAAFERRH